MQNKKPILFLVPLLGIFTYFLFFSTSSEEALRQSFKDLAKLASFEDKKQHPLEALKSARQVATYFVDAPQLEFGLSGGKQFSIRSKEELTNRLSAMRRSFSRFELSLEIKKLSVKKQQAELEVVAAALGGMPGADGSFFEAHLLRITSSNADGRWQIESIQHLKNLRDEELTVESVKEYFFPST